MTDSAAWDAYARRKPGGRRERNAKGETTWFNWTQYPDHGPGAEVLGGAAKAAFLELGCGTGGNLAHLATLGHRAVGVDVSPVQLDAARERWGDLPGLELHQRGALDFMSGTADRFDAVYSVFGAVWFTDPDEMLPAIRRVLAPGGVLAFSQRPAAEGRYGCQASHLDRSDAPDPLAVGHWDYAPGTWIERLKRHGFRCALATEIAAPDGWKTGTLLVRALAPGAPPPTPVLKRRTG
ncbi:methyltransferase type 11 [Streptomyces eurocidicus]|uniref:Methyltransferase type 11 n=1 Tax=Streptomyces eurocidicus TaxID=66423 RepID=A0A2N8NWY0_STREU|nr:class I SAM-dependent methyltransferase [Streptomyces eurocidicus]MBB5117906.1 SAM-dependent methyltransferase [Streptomyces eurocidicus]MBF6053888.1 methyltransferase domain-containing protein [Streptomyces eurocidicus]PNE33281.1 methyltransferase type 11 [Streptomyces eurocidicus]